MNNTDVLAIQEFRRFVNQYIYLANINKLISDISSEFVTEDIHFDINPQHTVRFSIGNVTQNYSCNTLIIHNILKNIFSNFFSNSYIVKSIRQEIHNNISDDITKQLINQAVYAIQTENPQYMNLLFNIAQCNNQVYVYL